MSNEEILNKICREGMIQWNLTEFKKTHPHLFDCIIKAMGKAHSEGFNKGRAVDNHAPL